MCNTTEPSAFYKARLSSQAATITTDAIRDFLNHLVKPLWKEKKKKELEIWLLGQMRSLKPGYFSSIPESHG